ncbi:hypothetical protein ACFY41_13165 [Streptomyces syringium]|uniref:hypothetical protein n=1 Tax=Streptomyces syringium TaxID=76729 RepID=UPI0036CD6933
MSAAKVCNSLLSRAAAGQLDELTGLSKFTDEHKEVPAYSSTLRKVEESKERRKEQELCRITADLDKASLLTVAISFWWSDAQEVRPRPETISRMKSGDLTLYPIGVHSEANDFSATIQFACADSNSRRNDRLLRAGLWTANTKLTGQAGRNARITILNAAARKIARQLDCLDTANLPETFHKVT